MTTLAPARKRARKAHPAATEFDPSKLKYEEVDDDGMTFIVTNNGTRRRVNRSVEFPGMCLGSRTRAAHPYAYDPYLQWTAQQGTPRNAHGLYSDRLAQWDYKKYRELCKHHFAGKNGDGGGDYFTRRSPEDIEAFLRDYLDKPQVKLVRVEEHCNAGNGHPVWVFYYVDPTETPVGTD